MSSSTSVSLRVLLPPWHLSLPSPLFALIATLFASPLCDPFSPALSLRASITPASASHRNGCGRDAN